MATAKKEVAEQPVVEVAEVKERKELVPGVVITDDMDYSKAQEIRHEGGTVVVRW
jgi:hypothetical protein